MDEIVKILIVFSFVILILLAVATFLFQYDKGWRSYNNVCNDECGGYFLSAGHMYGETIYCSGSEQSHYIEKINPIWVECI